MIQLQNISKEFKTKKGIIKAVDGINLHVKKGQIHGVIGYSGAGKSTL
ncbi:ATP-binding cassette domain-containing protein, partial [Lysinibacillus sp. D4B2_S17]